ncbi:hypothetical protein D0T49_01225 [Paludibacter sp. 221]|uniref:hypothetical protein n=1 Tax=Paludibacter sp. 221 TaxID=2302939 RepID=UPI0013D71E03|nr:hypothetical protein [Paludibacter sp. 221]NDV45672.1 hypothetical protein [Paludibacter sp. 221]
MEKRRFGFIKYSFLLIAFLCTFSVTAQDIEAMAKAPILTMNGGISLSQIATYAPDNPNADPYALYLGGNLSITALGVVTVPLSFAYTNQQLSKSVSLPFNRFSIAPSYKWVKVYAGYTSMQFSPYSLAGHELFGGGIELTPDNGWKFSALFGRMKKPNADESDPSYRRMGGGFNVEYQHEKFDVGINLFKAQDIADTNPFPNPDSIPINPQDNLTGSIKANLNIVKNLRIGGEYGMSAVNRGMTTGKDDFNLLHTKGDMAVYHAGKAQVSYTFFVNTIGATYERVAPNYTTLGAYYMTNDYENITANFSTSIKKINIALDGGYQRNNLDEQKTNTTSRLIYSANISSAITEKLNLSVSLSNLQAYVYVNDIYSEVTQTNQFQNLDTLNVTQLNYTASLNASYLLESSKERRQSTNLNFMYQKSAEAQKYSNFAGNDIFNTSLSYQFSLIPSQFNASASVSNNYNKMPENMYINAMTYNVSLQKTFFKLLKSSLTATFSDMYNQEGAVSNVLNVRLSGGYTLAKKHNFNLAMTLLHTSGVKTQNQFMGNLSYSYAFNTTLTREEKKLKLKGNF